MKSFKFVLCVLLALAFSAGHVFAETTSRVKVIRVLGEAEYLPSKGAAWKMLNENKYLHSGDGIKTGNNSYVELAFDSEKSNIVKINAYIYLII